MAPKKRKPEKDQIYWISTEWNIKAEDINKIDRGETVIDVKRPVPNLNSMKYYLKFYPNWEKKCRLYLYLEMKESLNLIVNARVTIETANFIEYWTHIYKNTDSYGTKICLSEELFDPEKKLVVGNQISINFEATLTPFDIEAFPVKKIKADSLLGPKLWENESGKNARIIVDGKEIKVHQCVIQSRSTIFESVCKIEPGTSAPATPQKLFCNIGVIKNYKFEIVEKAVMFCYDLPCIDKLSTEDAVSLLRFAEEFHMKDFKESIEEFCIKKLSISNACLFANSAITTMAYDLYQSCFAFLLKCMKDGKSVKDIKELDDNMQKELFIKAFSTS